MLIGLPEFDYWPATRWNSLWTAFQACRYLQDTGQQHGSPCKNETEGTHAPISHRHQEDPGLNGIHYDELRWTANRCIDIH